MPLGDSTCLWSAMASTGCDYYRAAIDNSGIKNGGVAETNLFKSGLNFAPLRRRNSTIAFRSSPSSVCLMSWIMRDPPDSFENTAPSVQAFSLPEEVRLVQTLELGVPLVVETLWERLKLGPILRKVMGKWGGSILHERALLAMTAKQPCEPDSKLGVWDRWLQNVYMPSCSAVKLYQMYEAMGLLHWNVSEVENAVFFSYGKSLHPGCRYHLI